MKNSKRSIVVSQIANSQISTSEHKLNFNSRQTQHNYLKNDLNIIQHHQSNIQPSHNNSSFEDEDYEIIQSMKEKQKLIEQLNALKLQVRNQNHKIPKLTTKTNKLPGSKLNKLSVKINQINSFDKKTSSTHPIKLQSAKHKANKTGMFSSSSVKTVGNTKSRQHLLDQFKSKKTQPQSLTQTLRKSVNTGLKTPLSIVPTKLQYDPDMLVKSSNKNYLMRRKQKEIEAKTNDYGFGFCQRKNECMVLNGQSLEVKDNSQKIPFRFQY